jgi:3-oxoacyl-[acyl-carrier-protein] synthase II
MQRVVVTGLGPVSSIGIGVEPFCAALRLGRCGLSPIRSFDTTGFPSIYAGEVPDFVPERILRRLDPAAWGRSAQFAAAAARLAANDGRFAADAIDLTRVAVVIGTTCGESQVVEKLAAEALHAGLQGQSPALVEMLPAGRIAHAASAELGAMGESMTISTACSASNYTIGYAFDLLRAGEADVAFAGGAESVCRWAHAGFYRLGALASKACTPFDKYRSGMLTAEGGSVLMLETFEHAQQRGVEPYAEILGYSVNCDAHHMVSPDPTSIAECMRLGHRNANVQAADVDYICAHGTGTVANDIAEAQAIREVFGSRLPPLSSIKSMIGHTMGAASGFGAIASTLAIRDQFLPPTIGWSTRDEALPELDPVPHSRPGHLRIVQNNGFAFGGNNAILLLGRVS